MFKIVLHYFFRTMDVYVYQLQTLFLYLHQYTDCHKSHFRFLNKMKQVVT